MSEHGDTASLLRQTPGALRFRRSDDRGMKNRADQSRRKKFAKGLIGKYMPTREGMANNKYLQPIAHRFLTPELWRFTRRSVPRGVALGLFSAFVIPLGQVFLAAFLALPARANVPVAALTTFITNPFTLAFWLLVANQVGQFILRIDSAATRVAAEHIEKGMWSGVLDAFEVAGVTVVGFFVLAVVTSATGYLAASGVWRIIVARKRAKRLRRMEARLDRRLHAK